MCMFVQPQNCMVMKFVRYKYKILEIYLPKLDTSLFTVQQLRSGVNRNSLADNAKTFKDFDKNGVPCY